MTGDLDPGAERRAQRTLDKMVAAQRKQYRRSMPALRVARAVALLLAGVVLGLLTAIALDSDLSCEDAPPHDSDPSWVPSPEPPMCEDEVDC